MATLTVRPTSATGSNWQNTNRVYDGNTSQAATVSINSSNYSQRTLTVQFSTSSIPQNAQITKATLTVIAKQSSSNSTRRITVQADINGSSSSRVINKQLTSTSNTTLTADIANYMGNLSSLKITGVTSGSSYQSQTFSIYEIYVDVEYEVPVEYTITYRYLCNGQSIKTSTTEKVTSGTYKTFNINNAPLIDGYTVLSVSPTSATVNSDTTVTFTYKKNVVGTTVDIYLPQPLGTGDRLYWNEAEGKYYIEHSTGIIQTEIAQKIEFDNYANSMTVQVDDSQVAPSSMTAWIAKKEVSSGSEPSEGEWVKATLRQGSWSSVDEWHDLTGTEAYYYSTDIIYMTDANRLSWDITGVAAEYVSGMHIYFLNNYTVGAVSAGDYEGTISLDIFDYLDATAIYIMIDTQLGVNPTDINLSYKTYTESTSSNPITPGEWQDANMSVGYWTAVDQWFDGEIQNSTGGILRSSELIDIRNKDVLDVKIPSTASGELFFYEDYNYAGGVLFTTTEFTVNLKNVTHPDVKWLVVGIYTKNTNTSTQYRLSEVEGGEPSEGGWITATMTDDGSGYHISESIYLDDNLESIDISSAAMFDPYVSEYEFYVDIYAPGSTEYDDYISLHISEAYDTVSILEIHSKVYNAERITIGVNMSNPHFEYRLNYKGSGGGGTEQESDWVEADMQVGMWITTTELDSSAWGEDDLWHYTSEIIYLDGLKTIEARGIDYDPDYSLGIYVYISSGEQINTFLYVGRIDVQKMVSEYKQYDGVDVVAIAIACYYLPNNDARVQYKLTR